MIRRARFIAVVVTLLAGAIGVMGSTQTWIEVTLADGAAEPLLVPGSDAVSVLTPLSLTVLALGGALSIVGTALRYALGAIGLLIALALGWSTAQLLVAIPVTAYASTVTDATGIAGTATIAGLVSAITVTPWVAVTAGAQVLLAAASLFVLFTAHRWTGGAGRRYRTSADAGAAAASRPRDAIDSWDDLSRGDDPTASSEPR